MIQGSLNDKPAAIPSAHGGSREMQAKLWGARAEDWASIDHNTALYESALDSLRIRPGDRLLDVGCGTGEFCRRAHGRGASVVGFDATPQFLEIAKRRCPECTFDEGDMEALPYRNAEFDFVTGFNSFQFAANPQTAIYEAKRVAKVGAMVLIATWGRPEQCQAAVYLKAVSDFLPEEPGRPGPFALSEPGALEEMVKKVRLDPEEAKDVECVWEFPDEASLTRKVLSAGPSVMAISIVGEDKVKEAVINAMTPFKTPTGGYRLTNVFRYLVSST